MKGKEKGESNENEQSSREKKKKIPEAVFRKNCAGRLFGSCRTDADRNFCYPDWIFLLFELSILQSCDAAQYETFCGTGKLCFHADKSKFP